MNSRFFWWGAVGLLSVALCIGAYAQNNGGGAPVTAVPQLRANVNASIKITAGGTFQLLLAAPTSTPATAARWAIQFQNNNKTNSTDLCYIDDTGSIAIGARLTDTITCNGQSMTAQQCVPETLGNLGAYGRYGSAIPSNQIVATCDTTGDSIGGSYQ